MQQKHRFSAYMGELWRSWKPRGVWQPRDTIQVKGPSVIMISMPDRKTLPKTVKRRRGKKQYDVITYQTRLNLILMVLQQGQSCTSACEILGVKLTTGCLILRTFKTSRRVMRKKDPHALKRPPINPLEAQIISELEQRVRLLIQREGASEYLERSQDVPLSLDHHSLSHEQGNIDEKQEEGQVKQEHFEEDHNYVQGSGSLRIDDREVKVEEMQSQGAAQPQMQESMAGWIVPTIFCYPWPFYFE